MLYKDLQKNIKKEDLSSFNYLINNLIKLTKEELDNKKNIPLNKVYKLKKAMKNAKTKPLQYIVGNVDFYGYIYKVNKNVLIPRFETEELVEKTINYIKKHFNKDVSILDIATGSGCIGITLKKELPNSIVTISDISRKALRVAKTNSKKENIRIIRSNMIQNIKDKYDVIISNPPYIAYDEEIMDIIKENEPHLALYAKNDGLYYYEEILKDVKRIINKDFLIAFEIGYTQKDKIIKIINKYLKDVNIICEKDLQEKDRMIFIMNKK